MYLFNFFLQFIGDFFDTVETIPFGGFIRRADTRVGHKNGQAKCWFASRSISSSRSVCNWLSNYISTFRNFHVQCMRHQMIPQCLKMVVKAHWWIVAACWSTMIDYFSFTFVCIDVFIFSIAFSCNCNDPNLIIRN
jgi:hypothetical protein